MQKSWGSTIVAVDVQIVVDSRRANIVIGYYTKISTWQSGDGVFCPLVEIIDPSLEQFLKFEWPFFSILLFKNLNWVV